MSKSWACFASFKLCFKNNFFRLNPDKEYLGEKIIKWLHLFEYHQTAQISSSCLEGDVIKHSGLNVKFNKMPQ